MIEYRILRRDGTVRWAADHVSWGKDECGKIVTMRGVMYDITEHKRTEEALRKSEARFRALFEHMAAGSCVDEIVYQAGKPVDYRILDVNPSYEAIVGISRSEAVGALASELYGTGKAPYLDIFTEVAETGEPASFESYFSPSGKHLHFTVSCSARGRFFTVFTDITERKQAERRLRESEQRLERVVKNINDALIVDDVAGRVVYANEKFFQLFGIPEPELHSITLEDYVAPEWRPALRDRHDRRVRGEPVPEHFEYEGLRCDGTRLWLEVSVTPVWEDGRITGTQSAIRDITARQRAEQELRELSGRLLQAQEVERRRIGKELHDSVAQDLAAVVMSLSGVKKHLAGVDDEARALVADCLAVLENSAQDVRNLSHLLHPPFLEEVGLLGALRQHVAGFSRRSGIKVSTEFPEAWARLSGEAELALFRVAQEALSNASRHSGTQTVTIRLQRTDDTVTLEVADRGHGLADSNDGLTGELPGGIGIPGMRERLRHLGGTLEIESSEDGTTVRAVVGTRPASECGGLTPL